PGQFFCPGPQPRRATNSSRSNLHCRRKRTALCHRQKMPHHKTPLPEEESGTRVGWQDQPPGFLARASRSGLQPAFYHLALAPFPEACCSSQRILLRDQGAVRWPEEWCRLAPKPAFAPATTATPARKRRSRRSEEIAACG